ncbi:MAG: D-alanyl-D-alanine carboxypeptidase [Rhodospirillaceae bacterium]|nr:D-alanyl-D-alanine carboxypeptidase [Rhodospirillaceae bacterium]
MRRTLFRLLSRPVLLPALLAILAFASGVTPAAAFETSAREAILLDFDTGAVLLEKNADKEMPPASMSKLMTTYMVFERLEEGSLKLDDTMTVSEKAWRMGGSKMFVEVGDSVTVENLLQGIIVQSGNDACIVVAEALAGSEDAFAEMMTRKAKEIGLTHSHFVNASGWPADGQYMSVRDLATLTKRIILDFPKYFPYYSEKSFTYNEITQGNRNPLLYKDLGVDGMKTGHTAEAGYGLTATAERDGRRLIMVVTGLDSAQQRSIEGERLLNYGFREFGNYHLFDKGETVEQAEVWLGDAGYVPLVIDRDLTVTLPRRSRDNLKVSVVYDGPIPAPIEAGTRIAKLVVAAPGVVPFEIPLAAGQSVGQLSMFGRIGAALEYLVWGPPTL